MLEAFLYVFTSLNSPSYPEIRLFPVYRQGIARLNISLSKNILTVINGKDRTGTFLLCSFHMWPSSCFFQSLLSQSSCGLIFKPYLVHCLYLELFALSLMTMLLLWNVLRSCHLSLILSNKYFYLYMLTFFSSIFVLLFLPFQGFSTLV